MDGLDEGLFGWVTINYLQGGLRKAAALTSAVLDLGGGSTQIALSVPSSHPAHAAMVPADVMGASHRMFLFSYLGYGLMAARAKVLGHNLPAGDARRTGGDLIVSPCLPSDTRDVTYKYGVEHFRAGGTPATGFEACKAVTHGVMHAHDGEFAKQKKESTTGKGVPQPAPGQPVVALSYYFDRAVDAKIVPKGVQEGSVTPAQYMAAAKTVQQTNKQTNHKKHSLTPVVVQICGLTKAEVEARYNVSGEVAEFLCLDLCFISSLLTAGFHLDENVR
jgi:hypothetical protein